MLAGTVGQVRESIGGSMGALSGLYRRRGKIWRNTMESAIIGNHRKIIGNHRKFIGNYEKVKVCLRFFDNY